MSKMIMGEKQTKTCPKHIRAASGYFQNVVNWRLYHLGLDHKLKFTCFTWITDKSSCIYYQPGFQPATSVFYHY